MAILAPNLLPLKTELDKDVATYNPERVMRQLGYDQGAIRISTDTGTLDAFVGEARFIRVGRV